MEKRLVPYDASFSIEGDRVLVLAPHPGDDVFGCAGAIMRHVANGAVVRVIVVADGTFRTDGIQNSDLEAVRREENCRAAGILGYGTPEFWSLQGRSLEYGEQLVQRISNAIDAFAPDLIYAPSIHEVHPNRRALAMAAMEVVRRHEARLNMMIYEVGVPLPRTNRLLDISDLVERKQNAMSCFVSQLNEQAYDEQISALNRFRTYALGPLVAAAEAYQMVQQDALKNKTLELYESEYQRQRSLGLAVVPEDVPLVSVIIRSMDRPMLRDALDSVALQTYANVEVVVVNAKGTNHRALGDGCGRFPLRLVQSNGALARPAAANFGMESAKGKYLIFLDDDDFFLPNHLEKLTRALAENTARASYTGIKLVDSEGRTVLVLDEPWEVDRLRGANFLPIHAVLFERSLLDDGCRFRENLECLEDWEFWLQVAALTVFQHVPEVSAVYRIALGTSGLSAEADAEKHIVNRALIFEAWLPRFTSREWVRSFHWFEMARNHYYQMALDRFDENRKLETSLSANVKSLVEMHLKLDAAQAYAVTMSANVDRLNRQIGDLQEIAAGDTARADALQRTVEDLVGSTSWRVTGLLRFVSRIARGQHQQAFDSIRRRLFTVATKVGVRLPPNWSGSSMSAVAPIDETNGTQSGNQNPHLFALSDTSISGMVDIGGVPPLDTTPEGRIAVHAHIFYADVALEFADFLNRMPFAFDLFVSVPSEDVRKACETSLARLPTLQKLKTVVVPNRGRDIAPMFCTFGEELRNYDYLAHIHSKKSLYNDGATQGWREYLLGQLFGNPLQIRKIFTLLTESTRIGFIYPQNYSKLPYWANTWLSNRSMGRSWCQRLGIENVQNGYFNYPAGSMFWARTEALKPLFDLGLSLEDFPVESGQKDATLAHCLERLLALTANHSGFKTAILRDATCPRWSAWGFEQYLGQTSESVRATVSAADVKLVIIDIFDTLLLRPLLNPESTKAIVAQRAGGDVGKAYLQLRAQAEGMARQRAGRDVDLDAIFVEFAALSGLPEDAVFRLRRLEESVERESVAARPDVVNILQFALSQGKRVVLASDMYLPRSVIESMLSAHGILGWHDLYLSSDIGLRKDTGDLYRHILMRERVTPAQILMIGDNEHSDVQIPNDMGMKVWHVMRPVELAHAIPRLVPLVEHALSENDLNEELTLGLLLRTNLNPVFYPNFSSLDLVPPSYEALGYTVLGPLVLSFVQWLAQQASADGIETLYFLSREGEFLKQVYDIWGKHADALPPSEYLVLSRRAVTVPMIRGIDEIEAIARSTYFENHVSTFVWERFGLMLTEDEWSDISMQGLVNADKLVEVIDGQIDHLKPLLAELSPRILAQAQAERPGIMTYLNEMGLNAGKKCALVDVGYAATIQGRLNQLLDGKVHGYYMMTDNRAEAVSNRYGVTVRGCFGQYVHPTVDATALLVQSFDLEKLLSSDQAQIIRYGIGPSGEAVPEVRVLSRDEVQCQPIRAEVRKGALEFVDDAIATRTKLFGDFVVPTSLGRSLYETLVKCPSEREVALLRALVLDDYYCGRGLVN
jgi:predicted HAD superfamily hydrolase/LmbE family N-acetylglucosaminyl deacetylase/glycosyltransferase involved in cell wall biosynthesis